MDIVKLQKEIEKQREEMTSFGLKYGLTNCQTVKSSQQLDQLLNKLEYLNKTKL
ncbi:aspartyl-phosphate phosphatase Spo0E family protein [Bacillus sp. BGMRC 2118]|nr:aspartyl-phosphate phosphatase Spo0E family protein [Bacillus sp. BGMRC 2118]